MTIAEEVRALRSLLGQNTAEFAKRWQRSGRTIEAWEQGRSVPDAFVLAQMRKLAVRTLKKSAKR